MLLHLTTSIYNDNTRIMTIKIYFLILVELWQNLNLHNWLGS